MANLSQPEGFVAAPEAKGEVQRFDEWRWFMPCANRHDVRCKHSRAES